MEEKKLLQSWKEISNHLNCSLRTCHRWEEDLDLPVHRLNGTPDLPPIIAPGIMRINPVLNLPPRVARPG